MRSEAKSRQMRGNNGVVAHFRICRTQVTTVIAEL